MTSHDNLMDWDQLADLLGEPTSGAQRLLLADMWREMIVDLNRELVAVGEQCTDTEVKEAMHRLRGFVSMWGLSVLARRMQAVEKAASPLAEWQREREEIIKILVASQLAITERHPWLGGAGGQ